MGDYAATTRALAHLAGLARYDVEGLWADEIAGLTRLPQTVDVSRCWRVRPALFQGPADGDCWHSFQPYGPGDS